MSDHWESIHAAIAAAREAIATGAPDAATAAEGEAYVARLLAAGLGGSVLGHLFRSDGLSRALPTCGGPNPDYLMYFAGIDPSQGYCLTGQLNGSERVGVGLYRPGPGGGTPIEVGYVAFDAGDDDASDTFTLTLSADASGPGTLKIPADARILLIRVLHRENSATPAQLRLEGDAAPRGLALQGGSTEAAIAMVAGSLAANFQQYLLWTEAVQKHPNRFEAPPPALAEGVQGDPDTQYYLGSFDLAENEWLEVTMPAELSGYWSVHAYNYWFEHLQTPGTHDRNARVDAAGQIRIAIGPDAPEGVGNWINTLGRRRGSLICRVVGTGECPMSKVRQL